MIKTNIKLIAKQVAYAIVGVATILAYFPSVASAAQITARKVTIGNSTAGATTTYVLNFTIPSGALIKSIAFNACDQPSGSCTHTTSAAGFDGSTAALASQPTGLGSGGAWATTGSTAYSPRIVNGSNAGTVAASAVAVSFSSSIKNPTGTPATFYIQITTYTSADCTTGATDTGTVAASTAAGVTVAATVDESLAFSITAGTAVVMSPSLTSITTGTGTSALSIVTNGSGYSIGYSGTTLTSGTNFITAMSAQAASVAGTAGGQFGINLMVNTTPAVGTVKTGSGTIAANYATANSFKFLPAGEAIATGTNTLDTYTVSYIANIPATQAPGAYTATANYVATATF